MSWSYRADDSPEIIRLWADIYDDLLPDLPADADVITRLEELCGNGDALELGVGTGRVAIPLSRRGVAVTGVDNSTAMIDRLRRKDPEGLVEIVEGDFTTVKLPKRFALVFILQNTFEGLGEAHAQQQCLARASEHLDDGGVFAIQAFSPHGMLRYGRLDTMNVDDITPAAMRISALKHEPLNQVVKLGHLVVSETDVRYLPAYLRYVWPSELDLMAEKVGLRLRHRWGEWNREAFSEHSWTYISLYERAA
jgi:SAM-dependent methyltransferase